MSVKRVLELAEQRFPTTGFPVVLRRHNITLAENGKLAISIYLRKVNKWQVIFVDESELENPEKLVDHLAILVEST